MLLTEDQKNMISNMSSEDVGESLIMETDHMFIEIICHEDVIEMLVTVQDGVLLILYSSLENTELPTYMLVTHLRKRHIIIEGTPAEIDEHDFPIDYEIADHSDLLYQGRLLRDSAASN